MLDVAAELDILDQSLADSWSIERSIRRATRPGLWTVLQVKPASLKVPI
jgi:hypothetical protein